VESAWWLSLVALGVAIVANHVGYLIGHKVGTRFVARRGGKILNRQNLDRARDFLNRRGLFAIILARWLPWVRTLAPLIAGAASMDRRRFLLATSIGVVRWVLTPVLAGYYGSGLLDDVPWLQDLVLWGMVVCVTAGTVWGLWKYRQEISKPVEDERTAAGGVRLRTVAPLPPRPSNRSAVPTGHGKRPPTVCSRALPSPVRTAGRRVCERRSSSRLPPTLGPAPRPRRSAGGGRRRPGSGPKCRRTGRRRHRRDRAAHTLAPGAWPRLRWSAARSRANPVRRKRRGRRLGSRCRSAGRASVRGRRGKRRGRRTPGRSRERRGARAATR